MSMISAQCAELRAMAESVGMEMPQAATLMMGAADTIWELLCRLADAEDRVRKSSELCKLCEREAENAKLRELCSKFAQVVANDDVTFRKLREIAKRELGYDFIGAYDSSLGDMDQLPLFSDRMRELGVDE